MTFNPTDYNTGLCDCCMDCCSCVEAYFCTTCQLARQYHAATTRTQGMDGCRCLCYTWCGGFILCYACCVRQTFNDAFKINESGMASCLSAMCCPLCSITQVYRELSIRGVWPGGCCVSAPFVHPTIPTQNPNPPNQTIVVINQQQPTMGYAPMQPMQPMAGYPQGGQPPQGAYPPGTYPQGGQPPQGAYPPGTYPQGGQPPQGAYPPGTFPQGGQPPQGAYPPGSYPQGYSHNGYPPADAYQPPPAQKQQMY